MCVQLNTIAFTRKFKVVKMHNVVLFIYGILLPIHSTSSLVMNAWYFISN